jgi:PAS domain S-box-containing protein
MHALAQSLSLPSSDSAINFFPLTVAADITVLEAVALMNKHQPRVSCILVMENSRVAGWLTEQDFLSLLCSSTDLKTVRVAEVMNTSVITLKQSDIPDNIVTLLSLLRQHRLPVLPIVDKQGQLVGVITRDTICQSLERQAQKKIGELEQTDEQMHLLSSAVVNANDAIIISKVNTTDEPLCSQIVYVNEAFTRMSGWLADEVIGKNLDILYGNKNNGGEIDKILSTLVSGSSIKTKLIGDRKNGSKYWVEVNISPIPSNPEGKITPPHFVCIQREITEDYQAEIALQKAQAALKHANAELELRVEERTKALVDINRQLIYEIADRQLVEEQLRQSQEMLQLIMDAIPQCVLWKDTASVFLGCNRNFAKLVGLENPEDVVGKTDYDLTTSEEANSYLESDTRVMATDTPEYHTLLLHQQKDGKQIWLEANKIPLHDAEGKVMGVLATFEDVTPRKQAQEALEKSEERFRFLAESIPQQVWMARADGSLEYVNQHILEDFACALEQVLDWKWQQYVHPEDLARSLDCWNQALATGKAYETEFRLLKASDNSYRWHLSRAIPLHNEDGQIVNWFGTNTDIHDHKQAQEALQESEERFRNLVETTNDLVWEVNEQSIFTYVSPQTERILGYKPDEEIGRTPFEHIPPEEGIHTAQLFGSVVAARQPFKLLEIVQIHKDGYPVTLEVSGVPVFDTDGTFRGYRGMSRDISDRKQADAVLRKTQEQLQAILDNSPAIVHVVDTQDRYQLINRQYEELFQIPEEQIVGKSIYDIWSAEIADEFAANNLKVLTEGIPIEVEEVAPLNNELRTYLSIKFPLKDADGIPYAVCGISTDITERKLAEDSLLRFRKAIESASDAIGMIDLTGKRIYVNPAFFELFEYTAEELEAAGGPPVLYVSQEECEQIFTKVNSGEPWRGEATMQTKSGRIVRVEIRGNAIKDATGKIIGSVGIHTDITERIQAEESLRLRDRAIAASSNGIVIADVTMPNSPIIYVNQAYEEITGYSVAEVIGQKSCFLHGVDVSQPELITLRNAIAQGTSCTVVLRNYRKDGSLFWNEISISPVHDINGQYTHYIGIQTDITERKQLEESLKTALQKEKELNELKSRFIAMTSHEFRTPLSTILSSSELLEHYGRKWTEEKQISHLHRIQSSVKDMTEMLNNVLVIGKADAGKLAVLPVRFDLVEYCQHLVEELQLNVNNEHAIKFNSQHKTIPCYMDEKLLGHILMNVLSNAIKYSPFNSTVQFQLKLEGEQAVFEIQDQGIGIPQEDFPHLFESFHRATNVGNIQGTGLGLAIVKRCIDIYQGSITVNSEIGVGTIITVTLPTDITHI